MARLELDEKAASESAAEPAMNSSEGGNLRSNTRRSGRRSVASLHRDRIGQALPGWENLTT